VSAHISLLTPVQSHLQHYAEPVAAPLANYGAVLPLGQGSLTRNPAGVPIVVVCTRADQMDAVGDEMGMKGGGWEERTDWIQQVLRTVCLAHGAALFYTAPTQPQTYTLLREYLFHRLYTAPAAGEGAAPARFPFPHRANVLDRDAVMVPAGWDSWGKITILREPFDPARVAKAWDVSAARNGGNGNGEEDEGIEDLWATMIPDTERPAAPNPAAVAVTSEAEQGFLQRQLDSLVKSDAKGVFRRAAETVDERYGVVGPMGTGGLSLPGVEKAMAEMEGNAAEDVGARFHARKVS
jgi:dynein light intermediate chain 1